MRAIDRTFDKVCYAMMQAYPSLYPTEEDVIHELFFGSYSYTWCDGRLGPDPEHLDMYVEKAYIDTRFSLESQLQQATSDLDRQTDPILQRAVERIITHTQAAYRRATSTNYVEIERAHELAYRRSLLQPPTALNPLRLEFERRFFDSATKCWVLRKDGTIGPRLRLGGANILNIPNDIRSDWLDAAERALGLIEQWEPSDADKARLTGVPDRIAEIRRR